MSAFYDLASLVLVPSGTKSAKIYAQKPMTTDGQLAFSRSTTATRVASNGLIEKVRTNLITYSEQFDNAAWAKTNATVTANTTANPINGALTADTITLAAGTVQKFLAQALTHSGSFTKSVYLKAGTHQFVQILISGNTSFANFDLVNGTSSASGGVATITAVANGFYRCTFSYTVASGLNVTFIAVDSLAAIRAEATSSTGNFIAFGFQSETGDIATDYIATTSAAVSVGPVANVPRLDYLNSSCPRLLLEPQRQNLVLFSEQLDNAYWTNAEATTVSANVGVSPDGYTNADKLIPQATSNLHRLSRSFTVTTATPYTFSAFVKRAGYDYFLIRTSDAANNNIGYDLLNGTVTYTASGYTSFIESYGNDWYRIGFVRSFTASSITINFRPNPTIISTNALDNITGDGTSGGFVWGAQLELGAYATSYVNTLNSAVTRGADACSKTGISSLIGQTEGTLFVEAEYIDGVDDARVSLSDGTTNNWMFISAPEPTGGLIKMRMYINEGGVNQVNKFSSTIVTKGVHKYAMAYKANDVVMYLDGNNEGSDTLATIPACSRFDITGSSMASSALISTGIKQVIFFPTRLSNADLATLTTI